MNRLGRHLGVVLDCHLHLIQKDYDKSFIGDEIAKLQDGIWDVFKKISDFETFQPLDSEDEIFYKKIGDFYEYLKTYSIQPDAPIVEYDSTGNMENITLPDGRVLTAEEFRELE